MLCIEQRVEYLKDFLNLSKRKDRVNSFRRRTKRDSQDPESIPLKRKNEDENNNESETPKRDASYNNNINNIAVVFWKKDKIFTKRIDLGPSDATKKDSTPRLDLVNCHIDENIIITRHENYKIISVELENTASCFIKFKRWLIGFNWNVLQEYDKNNS